MSLTPEMIESLRRQLRGSAPAKVVSDHRWLEAEIATETPKHFDNHRVWLYRLCIFLPKQLLQTTINLDPDLVLSTELNDIVKICNRSRLPHPITSQGQDWNARKVADCFHLLLSSRSRVTCINNNYCVMVLSRHPTKRTVQRIILDWVLQPTNGTHRSRRRQ